MLAIDRVKAEPDRHHRNEEAEDRDERGQRGAIDGEQPQQQERILFDSFAQTVDGAVKRRGVHLLTCTVKFIMRVFGFDQFWTAASPDLARRSIFASYFWSTSDRKRWLIALSQVCLNVVSNPG